MFLSPEITIPVSVSYPDDCTIRCSTCNLNEFHGCPGHCGHIELPLPVYHVSFMDQLLRLLRGTCVYCHRFKTARVVVNKYICKLKLIRAGLIQEAEDMDDHIDLDRNKNKKAAASEDDSEDDDNDDIISQRNSYVKKMLKQAGISKSASYKAQEKVESVTEARRLVIKEFYAEMGRGKKCHNCGG